MYKQLKEKYPEATIVKFVGCTRHCPLRFRERWVYSALLWRFKGRPVSKLQLAKWTGVDRTRTLPAVLVRLINARLVVEDSGKYRAVQPSADNRNWFGWWASSGKQGEVEQLAYNCAVCLPGRGIIDHLVSAAVEEKKQKSAAALAMRYGVSTKTIRAARRRLAGLNQEPAVEEPSANQEPAVEESYIENSFMEEPAVEEPYIEPEPVQEVPKTMFEADVQHVFNHFELPDGSKTDVRRFCRKIKGLARSEMIVAINEMIRRFGKEEGLEDGLDHFIRLHPFEYSDLKQVLRDIDAIPVPVISN